MTTDRGTRDPAEVERCRQRLEEELEAARETRAQLEKHLDVKGDYGHGRGDPMVVDWELNLALRDKMDQEIQRLEAALAQPGYGICERCRQAIEPARLEVLPYTTLCITCARKS